VPDFRPPASAAHVSHDDAAGADDRVIADLDAGHDMLWRADETPTADAPIEVAIVDEICDRTVAPKVTIDWSPI